MTEASERAAERPDFSLVLGGPLYQLYLRSRLSQPTMDLVHRRILCFVLITWLPLAVLSALGGTFIGGVEVPFLYDFDVHLRFLVSLPMLIFAEVIVHRRLRAVVEQFNDRGLIAPEDGRAFESVVERSMSLRNSITAEVAIIFVALTGGYWLWRSQGALSVATWYAAPVDGSTELNAAGAWYAFASLTIMRFILYRWYFRLIIWYVFLFRVARLRLRLNALHPDRAGGLGFLNASVDALTPLLIAQSTIIASVIASRILHQGETLPQYQFLIFAVVVVLMIEALLPLHFFAFQLAEAKRQGLRQYGLLAGRYVDDFRDKWLRSRGANVEGPLGSADIQSLADLGNSYEVVRSMGLLPFGRSLIVRLATVIALPMLPLTLTMIPFSELIDRLIKIVL